MFKGLRFRGPAAPLIAVYGVLWALSTAYLFAKGADWTFPLVSLAIFGLALSGLAALLTRRAQPPAVPVARPGLELGAVLAFLGIYAVVFLGWGLGAARAAVPAGPAQELAVLALKLVVHVGLPSLLLLVLGASLKPLFDPGVGRRGFWPTLIVLGVVLFGLLSVVSPSLKQIAATHASAATLAWAAPATFVWYALEAGLCEEFLFRAVLQSRLAAVLKSSAGAVVIGAVLFSLAHVPGIYLRGNPEVDGYSTDVLQVAAFAIATLSPIALLFGTVWARTRSLLLLVLLHSAVDTLPNMAEFIRTWG